MQMAQGLRIVPAVKKSRKDLVAGGPMRFLHCCLESRWEKYRKALKRARKRFSVDSVHDLRIETRRMLTLLDLMRPFCPAEHLGQAERRFRKVFKSSGALRDAHVQKLYIETECKWFPELAGLHQWLRGREKRLTRRFEKTVKRGIKPKLKSAMSSLRKWSRRSLKEPGDYDARIFFEKVKSIHHRVLNLRRAVRANRLSTIHRLRISFKAYRYLVETLSPEILHVEPHLAELRNYQAIMGDIHDLELLLERLGKFQKSQGTTNLAAFRTEVKRRNAGLIKRFWTTPFPAPLV
jgi:CHAD domain-containing protein